MHKDINTSKTHPNFKIMPGIWLSPYIEGYPHFQNPNIIAITNLVLCTQTGIYIFSNYSPWPKIKIYPYTEVSTWSTHTAFSINLDTNVDSVFYRWLLIFILRYLDLWPRLIIDAGFEMWIELLKCGHLLKYRLMLDIKHGDYSHAGPPVRRHVTPC